MIRFIKIKYMSEPTLCVQFIELNTDTELGMEYVKLDTSWILSAKRSKSELIVCSCSNANKTKDPVMIYPLPDMNNESILVLKNSTDNFSSIMIDPDVWEIADKFHVTNFVPVWAWNDVNVITQFINGKCNNPVMAISGYEKIEDTTEPNGFQEHYLVNTKYYRKTVTPDMPSPIYRACILQYNGNGTTTLIYEITRRDGFNMEEIQHQVNPV